jgi:hypothetical protein
MDCQASDADPPEIKGRADQRVSVWQNRHTIERGRTKYVAPAMSGASFLSQISSGDAREVSIHLRQPAPSGGAGSSNASGSQYALIET